MRRPAAPQRRTRRQLIPIASAVLLLTSAGGSALAGGGGIDAPEPPDVNDAYCVERCADMRVAAAGSKIELTGRNLGGVETVTFNSDGEGRVKATARRASDRRVTARVPEGAASGRPKVKDAFGGSSTAPERIRIVAAEDIPEDAAFSLARAEAKPRKAYFDGRKNPAVSYTFRGDGPTDVRVDVIDRADSSVVASFRQRDRDPFAANVARWDGRTEAGRAAPDGNYRFRIGPVSGGSAETTDDSRFSLYGHKFPVRARHSYGDGFGAGRNHQGQDVFARCGSKLVAARGGRVTHKASHSSAGYYIVISGRKTRFDYMYAHLRRPSPLREGERVRTGEPIGEVGDTGNASGCHLHFELWKGTWYGGGSATPKVTRMLRRWDGWS
jgi:murein DD-endopeptidase MepM/ murein hydrolase activator NlpD